VDIWQEDSAAVSYRTPRRAERAARRRRRPGLAVAGYAALALACALLSVAAFLVVAAPAGFVRDRFIERVKARTGRELVVAGPTSFSLYPKPAVSLGQVSLSPPAGMEGAPTLTVPALDLELGFWPLLVGRVVPRRLTLYRPTIALAVDATGRVSWEHAAGGRSGPRAKAAAGAGEEAPPASARAKAPLPLEGFGTIRIIDGTVRYSDARSGARYELTAVDLTLAANEASDPLAADGKLTWRGVEMAFSATATPWQALLAGRPVQLSLKVTGPPLEAAYQGSLSVAGGVSLDGKIAIKAASAKALGEWLGNAALAAVDSGPVAGSAHLQLAERRATLSGLEALHGGTSVVGALAVDVGRVPAHVSGNLEVSELDLAALLLRPGKRARPPSAAVSEPPAGGMAEAKRGKGGWSDDAVNLPLLRLADADVAVSVGRLAYKDIETGRARLAVALTGGVAKVSLEDAVLYGGRAHGVLTLDGAGEVLVAGSALRLVGVSMPGLLGDALGFHWLDGRGNIALSLAGQGLSERQIVESLNGTVDFAVADGAMAGIDIGKIVRSLQQGRLPSFAHAPDDRTPFSEFSGTLQITNGVAANRDLRVVSTHLELTGEGTFALGARQMDYRARAKVIGGPPGERTLINVGKLELPLTISGSWDRPAFGIEGQEQLTESVKRIGKRLKSREVRDTIKGLLHGEGEERAKAREKARGLLEKFLKKE
jgi:AsmA protein